MNANAIYRQVAYALRAGKFRELLYSIFLECRYWWCYTLGIRSRLIHLTPFPGWRYCSERVLDVQELAASLRLCNFSLVESITRWSFIAERADGVVFGTTHDLRHVLRRADSASAVPTELFQFNRPIVSVFISM